MVFAILGVTAVLRSAHFHEHRHAGGEHDHEHVHDDSHHDHAHADPNARHSHAHSHRDVVHAHPHLPNLHHRHEHTQSPS
jgi:hypothetical protein